MPRTSLRGSARWQDAFQGLKNKHHYMPFVSYFKADAAEAEILTGLPDREEAARKIAAWGRNRENRSSEVMITYNTEVIVLVDGRIYRALEVSNLSGRTGGATQPLPPILPGVLATIHRNCSICSSTLLHKNGKTRPFSGNLEDVFGAVCSANIWRRL